MTAPSLADGQSDELARAIAQLTANVQAIIDAIMPAFLAGLQAAAQQFAELQQHLKDIGLLDVDGKPVPPVDRPAWQSPYGPPERRH